MRQHQISIKDPGKRGQFYSNTSIKLGHPENPQAFVIDVSMFHLFVDPEALPFAAKDELAESLSSLLRLTKEGKENLKAQMEKKSRSRKLAVWLEKTEKDQIQRFWKKFSEKYKIAKNALYFVEDYKRSYPFGKLLGQVLHTVRDDKDPKTGQNIPTGGLEMLLDPYLQSKDGQRLLLRSPKHPMDVGNIVSTPENGADIFLSINHYIQAIAEEEIAKAVKLAEAKSGWAIMMDPYTGEIFALAQYPFFEPSSYSQFFNDPSLLEHTTVKAITNAYEPGSTFKPITVAIALQANAELARQGKKPLFDPKEKMNVIDGRFPGRSKPIKDLKRHHYLNMEMALQKSSNVYVARLAQKIVDTMGQDWYRNMLCNHFGFGSKTGIELPSESPGLVPTPGKKYKSGHLEWSVPTPFSLGMGHNLMVNSMQMLRAFAILANGGKLVTPTIIRKIVKTDIDGNKQILLDNTTENRLQSFLQALDPAIGAQVVSAMKFITKPGGTAVKADIYGYTEAGKTGTSEKIINGRYSKDIHFSTFIGFTPAIKPRFVLLIAIDEPKSKLIPGIGKMHHGGNCAAPVFREIASRTLRYLGVAPDDPYGYPAGDPRHNAEKADWWEKSKQLSELYRQWNH